MKDRSDKTKNPPARDHPVNTVVMKLPVLFSLTMSTIGIAWEEKREKYIEIAMELWGHLIK